MLCIGIIREKMCNQSVFLIKIKKYLTQGMCKIFFKCSVCCEGGE